MQEITSSPTHSLQALGRILGLAMQAPRNSHLRILKPMVLKRLDLPKLSYPVSELTSPA